MYRISTLPQQAVGKAFHFFFFLGGGEGWRGLTINAPHTPLSVFKRRIQFLLITKLRKYGSHFWPRGEGKVGNKVEMDKAGYCVVSFL